MRIEAVAVVGVNTNLAFAKATVPFAKTILCLRRLLQPLVYGCASPTFLFFFSNGKADGQRKTGYNWVKMYKRSTRESDCRW